MNASPGIVTSGTGPPNAVVELQPGMLAQPVVLVDQNGQYVTTASTVMTTLGDTLYENAAPAPARLAGNTTSTKKFLTQTGNGTVSAAPGWNTIASGDLPAATAGAQGAVTLGYVRAQAQCGAAMLDSGYVGATIDFYTAIGNTAPGTSWASGTGYLYKLLCLPGVSVNGNISFLWSNAGGMANSFFALYTSAGAEIGATADQSSASNAWHRVAVSGFTAVPADGIIYVLYFNGTQASGGGPYRMSGLWTGNTPTPPGSAPLWASSWAGSLSAVPGSITLANFTGNPNVVPYLALD